MLVLRENARREEVVSVFEAKNLFFIYRGHKKFVTLSSGGGGFTTSIALTVDTDREALAVAMACCLKVQPATARVIRIRDTKHLERFYASESLLPELLATGRCEVVESLHLIRFDASEMLLDKEV